MYPKEVKPQRIEIRKYQLTTLNDFQKLLRDIQWLRPYFKMATGNMKPLFNILKGDCDPTSPRELTDKARQVIDQVEQAIQFNINKFNMLIMRCPGCVISCLQNIHQQ